MNVLENFTLANEDKLHQFEEFRVNQMPRSVMKRTPQRNAYDGSYSVLLTCNLKELSILERFLNSLSLADKVNSSSEKSFFQRWLAMIRS